MKSARKKKWRVENKSAAIQAYVYGSIVGTDCASGLNIEIDINQGNAEKLTSKFITQMAAC